MSRKVTQKRIRTRMMIRTSTRRRDRRMHKRRDQKMVLERKVQASGATPRSPLESATASRSEMRIAAIFSTSFQTGRARAAEAQ